MQICFDFEAISFINEDCSSTFTVLFQVSGIHNDYTIQKKKNKRKKIIYIYRKSWTLKMGGGGGGITLHFTCLTIRLLNKVLYLQSGKGIFLTDTDAHFTGNQLVRLLRCRYIYVCVCVCVCDV